MGKTSIQNFLKKYDRYAKNVTLSYKKSGSFETSIGGVCSIITFVILSYFLLYNLIETFLPPGDFSTSTSVKLSQDADGVYTELNIDMQQLFIAYDLRITDNTIPQD